MKLKDNILISGGLVAILLFIVFMFEYHRKVESHRLIREDLYSDSIIMDQYKDIEIKDSQINSNQKYILDIIDGHERRLRRLEKWKSTNKQTTWHLENQ